MFTLKKSISALALAGAAALVSGQASAATVLDAWNLNLSAVNGSVGNNAIAYAGLVNATKIDHIVVNGGATVDQNVLFGSTAGQSFTDTGYLALTQYRKEGSVFPTGFGLGTASALYLTYDGLTGIMNADDTITFNPGVGTIKLWLTQDADITFGNGGNELELASFAIAAPSGGSDLDFYGGTSGTSTVDVTLQLLSSIAPNLYTDKDGNNLGVMKLHLINVNSLLDPNYNPNPDVSGVDGTGTGVVKIRVLNAGQYNIPEPASVALMGLGLLAMGGIAARRKSA